MPRKPGRTPEQLERFTKFAEWYFTPKNKRVPPTSREICARLGVSEVTGSEWKHELEDEVGDTTEGQKEWEDHVKQTAKKGNSRALELWGKTKGYIGKNQDEGKLELTADEYYAILREARTRVSDIPEEPSGTGSLPDELPVLHKEVCEDSDEVEAAEDNTVGELAIPNRPDPSDIRPEQPDNSQGPSTGNIVVGSGVCLMADSI